MKRFLILITIGLSLTACQSDEEKKAEWIHWCSTNDFNLKQCEVLYSIAKSSSDAQDNATTASVMSSMAVGLAAGAKR